MKPVEKIKEFTGHAGGVYCLERGRFAYTVFSGAADGMVGEWNLKSLEPSGFSVKMDSPVFALLHVVEMHLLVAGLFNGHIHVIDLEEKKEVKHYQLPAKGIFTLFYDAWTKRLYAGGADGVLNVWNAETWEHMLSLPLCEGKIRKIMQGRNKQEMMVCCMDGSLRILETEFYNEVAKINTGNESVNAAMLTDNEIFTVTKDARIKIYDRLVLAELNSIAAHNYGIYDIVWWGQNSCATCSRDKTIKVWDFNRLTEPLRIDFKTFKGHTRSVNDLFVSEWNNYLISAGDDGKVMVWNRNNQQIRKFEN
ncbi:MAG TPA: hypothetical protein VD905_19120 [Flavobacteriales bacterium]|nr:hypothetical protein [Flavobacteriales bacterium]